MIFSRKTRARASALALILMPAVPAAAADFKTAPSGKDGGDRLTVMDLYEGLGEQSRMALILAGVVAGLVAVYGLRHGHRHGGRDGGSGGGWDGGDGGGGGD